MFTTIDLRVGDPQEAPEHDLQACLLDAASHSAASHYPPPQGLPKLREAITEYYSREHFVRVSAQDVLVTHGARGSLHFAIRAADSRHTVGYFSPYFMLYPSLVLAAGKTPFPIPLPSPPLSYQDLKSLLAPIKGGIFLHCSPHNPTGRVFDETESLALVAACKALDVKLISDFVYADLYQSHRPTSMLALDPDVVEIISISKPFRACGWRVGAVVGNPAWISGIGEAYASLNGVPYAFQQVAASAWTQMTGVATYRAEVASRRTMMIDGLRRLGFIIDTTIENAGAVFVWGQIPEHFSSASNLCELLATAGVLVANSPSFGLEDDRHIRIALNVPCDQLSNALARIRNIKENHHDAA